MTTEYLNIMSDISAWEKHTVLEYLILVSHNYFVVVKYHINNTVSSVYLSTGLKTCFHLPPL